MNAPLKIGMGVGAVAIVAMAAAWYESTSNYEYKGIKLLHNSTPAVEVDTRKSMDDVKPRFLQTPVFHPESKHKVERPSVTTSSPIALAAPTKPQQQEPGAIQEYSQNSAPMASSGGQRGRSGSGYIPRMNPQNGNDENNDPDDNDPDSGPPPDGGPGGPGGPGGGPGGPPDGGPGGGGPGGPPQLNQNDSFGG
jgi:hypothetical protein